MFYDKIDFFGSGKQFQNVGCSRLKLFKPFKIRFCVERIVAVHHNSLISLLERKASVVHQNSEKFRCSQGISAQMQFFRTSVQRQLICQIIVFNTSDLGGSFKIRELQTVAVRGAELFAQSFISSDRFPAVFGFYCVCIGPVAVFNLQSIIRRPLLFVSAAEIHPLFPRYISHI